MFSFREYIRELTIKFICLKFQLGNPTSIPLFLKGDTLCVFFLTIDVPIHFSWLGPDFFRLSLGPLGLN